ncbi:hypothetical protein HY990_00860 [Candidatus Micrarchaeota archaeon]|nr:hypothetical protein [Candidatus Micrarchaeota archaeon]
MKNRNLILILFLLLVFSGCTLRKPVSYGCCVVDESAATPSCTRLRDSSPSLVSLVSTNLCQMDNGLCNVTLRLTFSDDPSAARTETAIIPICTNTTSKCVSGDCTAMVCGPFKYDPSPTPSFSDTSRATSSSASLASDSSYSLGLYNKTCRLVDAGSTLDNFFTNTKGSFVNTFRFGFGSSFSEFDAYRYLFPTSDFFCSVNPDDNAKDRYMNYMMSPLDFQDYMRSALAIKPQDRASAGNFCPVNSVSPFFSTTYFNSPFPNYMRNFVSRQRYIYNTTITTLPPSGGSGSSSFEQNYSFTKIESYNFTQLDKKFYGGTLPLIYSTALEGFDSINRAAPFECESPTQCMSGLCNYEDYRRSICKIGSTWVECGCDKNARKCVSQTSIYNRTIAGAIPNTAAALQTYVDAYQDRGALYKTQVIYNATVHYARIDPDCSSGVVRKIDPQNCGDRGETCFDMGSSQVPDSPIFPSSVQFFGEVREGYIGYSFLSRDDFEKTDLVRNCHLEPGRDYIVSGSSGPPAVDPTELTSEEVTAVTATGAIFRPPSPIPERIGYQLGRRPHCATLDEGPDDLGLYTYVSEAILVRSAGDCELDGNTHMPITKTFGWCEGCTFSNIAKQVLLSNDTKPYVPLVDIKSPREGAALNLTAPVCNFAKNPVAISDLLSYPYNTTITGGGSSPFDPYLSPVIPSDITCPGYETTINTRQSNFTLTSVDSVYLGQKEAEFFREGTLPVLDLSDSSNWDSQNNLTITQSLIDRGPAVIIVSKIATYPSSGYLDTLGDRLSNIRAVCKNCLTSVELSLPFTSESTASGRYFGDFFILDALNRSAVFDNIDVISYDYYPTELIRDHTTFCTGSSLIRNQLLVDSIANFSSTMLRRYAPKYKLSLIPTFYFSSSCLNDGNVSLVFNYLLKNQKTLSRSGLIGIIYTGDASTYYDSGGHSTDAFCSIDKGAKNMLSSEPLTVYSKLQTTPAGNLTCQVCSDADLALGRCNPICDNGVRCTNPDSGFLTDEAFRLHLSRGSDVPLKCPSNSIPEPCTPCSARTERMSCDFFLADGSSYSQTYNLRDLSAATPDIISSIPSPYKCCVSDPGRPTNYTFNKQTTVDHTVAPIIFSRAGDPRQDCGVSDLSLLTPQMCGADAPFKNYRLRCRII